MDYYSNLSNYDDMQHLPQQNDYYFYNNNNYTQTITLGNSIQTNEFSTVSSYSSIMSKILIGIILYSLTIWTIIGNIFVWIALFTNKQLKQGGMSNYLIGNLALSDLLLGLTVLPFSATFSTLKNWVFGRYLCDIWLSIDVLCCTASIWGLLVIAIDRYIATNHPIMYRKQKNSVKTAIIYCTIAWIVSFAISIPPFVHDLHSTINKNENDEEDENNSKTISISKNLKFIDHKFYECVLYYKPSFVIASSLGSFYIPLILMVLLYARVFMRIKQQSNLFKNTASSHHSKKSETASTTNYLSKKVHEIKKQSLVECNNQEGMKKLNKQVSSEYDPHQEHTTMALIDENKVQNDYDENHRKIVSSVTNGKSRNSRDGSVSFMSPSSSFKNKTSIDRASMQSTNGSSLFTNTTRPSLGTPSLCKRNSTALETRRMPRNQMSISSTEARITKTLAIIIGCFILCWTPFFTAYIIRSQLDNDQISPMLMDVFIWLGYFNSSLNPILYAILNNNFRTAFKDILSCDCFRKRINK